MKSRRALPPLNVRDLAEAFDQGKPEAIWFSTGLVAQEDNPITFDPDLGPLVHVELQPSLQDCVCRVASLWAGNGEGECPTFVAGDEVLCLFPHGDPKAGGYVVAKANNGRNPFPQSVAGQDASKNNFGFRRVRTPYLQEHQGPIQLRDATTGAFISVDVSGTATIRDGAGDALQLSADLFSYLSSDAGSLFQIDLSGGRGTWQVSDAKVTLASSSAQPAGSSVAVPGNLSLMSGSNAAAEHAISTEAVANLLVQFGLALVAIMGPAYLAAVSAVPTPTPGAPMTPLGAPFAAALAAAFASEAAVLAALQAANVTPQIPSVAAAIVAAFAATPPKETAVVTAGFQPAPGIGCPNTFVG